MQQISHPSKEQVRAYMWRREHAHLPPPTPAEIRRQLGWGRKAGELPILGELFLVLPGRITQLSTLMALEWLFRLAHTPRDEKM